MNDKVLGALVFAVIGYYAGPAIGGFTKKIGESAIVHLKSPNVNVVEKTILLTLVAANVLPVAGYGFVKYTEHLASKNQLTA